MSIGQTLRFGHKILLGVQDHVISSGLAGCPCLRFKGE
jgi:hypothetical protein